MVMLLLENRGHTVFGAENGEQGVATIVELRPDVALVDIGLPDIAGYDVAARVTKHLADAVPLVALTGYGQPDDVRRCLEAGFARHLTKPLDGNALERALLEVVAQHERR